MNNNFLYDAGSELNNTTGMYDLPYRNYDATLGRFFQVDQLATSSHDLNPYHYAANNPIGANDPSGLNVDYSTSMENPSYVQQLQEEWRLNHMQNIDPNNTPNGWDIGMMFFGQPMGGCNSCGRTSKVTDAYGNTYEVIVQDDGSFSIRNTKSDAAYQSNMNRVMGMMLLSNLDFGRPATEDQLKQGYGNQSPSPKEDDPDFIEGVLFNRDNPRAYLPAAYFKYTSATGALRLEIYSYSKGMTDIIEMDADGNIGSKAVNALPKMDFIGQWTSNEGFTQIPRILARPAVFAALGEYANDFWSNYVNGNGYLMTDNLIKAAFEKTVNLPYSGVTFRFNMDLTFYSHNYNLVLNINY